MNPKAYDKALSELRAMADESAKKRLFPSKSPTVTVTISADGHQEPDEDDMKDEDLELLSNSLGE